MTSFVVFAKEPIPGQVKTRLTPPLPPAVAAALYGAFVEDVAAAVVSAAREGDRRVLAAPDGPGPVLQAIAGRHGFEAAAQVGADLGARMSNALRAELRRGSDRVVLVGSDSPSILPAMLRQAVAALDDGVDAVLGPAGDGGYWLVGCARSVPDLFQGIPWSTRDVLATTLDRAKERGISISLLPFWYDVDDVADLRMLHAHLEWSSQAGRSTAPCTTAALAEFRRANSAFFLASRGESTR